MKKFLLFSVFLLAAMVFTPMRLYADSVLLSPSVHEIRLYPDQDKAGYTIEITNNTGSTLAFEVQAVDFTSSNETGGIIFSPSESELSNRYRLAPWMRLSSSSLRLEPGQTKQVTITILNEQNLALGGHYGAVLFSHRSGSDNENNEQVTFEQTLSSLLFLTKLGGEHYNLRRGTFYYSPNLFSLPESAAIRFHNFGNVHTVPSGEIRVKDPFGRLVYTGSINQESGRILPESIRRYNVPLSRQRFLTVPGFYTVEVEYTHTGSTRSEVVEYSYFAWNLKQFMAVLFLILFMIYSGFWRYIRRGTLFLLGKLRKISIKYPNR